MFSFDHDLIQFVAIGTATVTSDGAQMCSDSGFGVTKSGWGGCVPPPPPKKCVGSAPPCQKCDQATGTFINDTAKNRQPCDDGNPCTKDDQCVDGKCIGTPKGPSCGPNSTVSVTYPATKDITTKGPNSTTAPSTTKVFTPTFKGSACLDASAKVWRFHLDSVTSSGKITIVDYPPEHYPNPTAGGNVTDKDVVGPGTHMDGIPDYCEILADLDANKAGVPAFWTVKGRDPLHEVYHWEVEWQGTFNRFVQAAEAVMESKTISCSGADDASVALAKLMKLVEPIFNKAYTDARKEYDGLGDAPGDPPYQAQIPAYEAMIKTIQDFAKAQKFAPCP